MTIKRFALKLLVLTALLCSVSSSFAVTLIEDNRFTFWYNNGLGQHDFYTETSYPSESFADWSHIRQTSTVTSEGFSGFGFSETYDAGFQWGYTTSTFDVTFAVEEAVLMNLQGFLELFGTHRIRLYAGSALTDPLLLSFAPDGSTFPKHYFQFVEVLDPGEYRLVLESGRDPGQNFFTESGGWSFSADFMPVPIPAVGWLMGVLILGLWGWRR